MCIFTAISSPALVHILYITILSSHSTTLCHVHYNNKYKTQAYTVNNEKNCSVFGLPEKGQVSSNFPLGDKDMLQLA